MPFTPDDLLTRILYRDGLMLVLNKPPGIAVHAGPHGGENLQAMFDVLRFGLPQAPGLAHRLDRETSGCLVLGRHRKALAQLGDLFAEQKVKKTYWAVVRGTLPAQEGCIDLPLSRRSAARGWWMMVDKENGQQAVTDYKVRASAAGFSWVELYPRTGRTHQIRVHLASLGAPILGDRIYGMGAPPPAGPMLHLHAWAISVPVRAGQPPVEVEALLPPHMQATMDALGFSGSR